MNITVIGAGLAGLSAAVRLASEGHAVEVLDSAAQAGGRCRSYLDPQLGMTIDNGNHLVLSGNHATHDYLRTIGAEDRLVGPEDARFDFCDVRDGARWTIRPNLGPLAWWVFSPSRRVPGTRATEYLSLLSLLVGQGHRRIDQAIPCEGPLWERLLEPFLLAALNTKPEIGSARLAGAVIRETLAMGGKHYRPRIAEPTLTAAFIDPAIAYLEARGGSVRLGERLVGVETTDDAITRLRFSGGEREVAEGERIVLATPPWITQSLLPEVPAPDEFKAIVNAHYRIAPPPGAAKMVGVIGGSVEWVFAFEDRLSVTVSGADDLVDKGREELAELFWRDVAKVHGLGPDLPPWQIVKEKRATFAATPEQDAKRPGARTRWGNLVLAGDWTDTGLPATIEGAIRSGHKAADLVRQAASRT